MNLQVETSEAGGITVFALAGRFISPDESLAVREQGKSLLCPGKKFLFDLSGVREIDSGVLGTLVELLVSARKQGGDLKLAGVPERVRKSLESTRLQSVFEILPDRQAALASFA